MNTNIPLRSILLSTNISDIEWLLPFVRSLANESGAAIKVLHVITGLNGMTVDPGGLPYFCPEGAADALKDQLVEFCSSPTDPPCEVLIRVGDPVSEILATAKQVHADMLVMGTRGHRGVEKWILGSISETVLRSSPIPVITVGPNARMAAAAGKPVTSLLLATSLREDASANITLAYKWSKRLQARLTLLHVVKEDGRKDKLLEIQACEDKLKSLLQGIGCKDGEVEIRICSGKPTKAILSASACVHAVILGANSNPGLGRLAPEGTSYQVLLDARCPVITLHN